MGRSNMSTLKLVLAFVLALVLGSGAALAQTPRLGQPISEADIKEKTKATIRVLPDEEFRSPVAPATCVWCERPSVAEAVWAKAY